MALSFNCHGQIQPIVVKPANEQGLYEGVVGRLRYEGAKLAGQPTIHARIREFKSVVEVREWQLAENLHRRGLTAIQYGEAYKELYGTLKEEFGGIHDKHIVEKIAKRLEELIGEKRAEKTIYDYIRITKLPKEVKEKIRNDPKFGIGHAKQILRLKDKPEIQLKLAEKFASKPVSVRTIKHEVNNILKPKPPVQEIHVGFFECPICHHNYEIVHIDPRGKHKLEEIKEKSRAR